ncbi:MAG: zf-HC2 domain-containing protein [Acidimicrobiia bacterium]|nr:zf-HC2 domain-containing protein [Acidimicrobiia bacterium]
MKVECHQVENWLGLYADGVLGEHQSSMIRAHLGSCETCAVLLLELEFAIALCKEYPELDPPPQLIERVLERTIGQHRSLSWTEYLRELFRPLYASPRFATGACLAAISLSIVMNALGINLGEVRWSEITPQSVVDSLHRTANVAYDNGMRRLNGSKILYQIQSRIEELQGDDSQPQKRPQAESESRDRPRESSATEHRLAVRTLDPQCGQVLEGATAPQAGVL